MTPQGAAGSRSERAVAFALLMLLACSREGSVSERYRPAGGSALSESQSRRECGMDGPPLITGDGIGMLRVGALVDSVHKACNVIRDTVALSGEATEERTLDVDVGADTLEAVVSDDRIWRISVRSPTLRSEGSVGVGTQLRTMLGWPGVMAREGEGQLYLAAPSACGLSFRLSYKIPADQHREEWSLSYLRSLPDTTSISEVLILGCGRTPR